jgi:hypothetical protein
MKGNKVFGKTNLIETNFLMDKIILKLAKQRKQIIYGARSIEKQAGLFARSTKDYDIFDKNPQKSAKILHKVLDKKAGFDYFYVAPAKHKGTWKVKGSGNDGKKGTEDDESIADYSGSFTGLPDNVKTVTRNGVRYRLLKYELQRKIAVTKDPEYAFRKKKDQDDINRIKAFIKIKKLIGGEVG